MSRKLDARNAEIPPDQLGVSDVLVDNDSVCITRHTVRPGQQTGWHVHEADYVGILQNDSVGRDDQTDGSSTTSEVKAGFFTSGKKEHNVVNVGQTVSIGFEIEFKV